MALNFPKWNRLKVLKESNKLATLGYAIPGAILAIGIMIRLAIVWLMIITTHLASHHVIHLALAGEAFVSAVQGVGALVAISGRR